jgi:hypothetical protein
LNIEFEGPRLSGKDNAVTLLRVVAHCNDVISSNNDKQIEQLLRAAAARHTMGNDKLESNSDSVAESLQNLAFG